jgi:Flp pilus assembly protein TadG
MLTRCWLAPRLADRCRSLRTAVDGNAAVIFALAVIPVMSAFGAGFDYARANRVKSEMQAALDSAVLTGVKQASGQQIATAGGVFSANFTDKSAGTPTTTFTVNADGSVTGTAQAKVATAFMQIVSVSTMHVSVTATAAASGSTNVCILLVDPSASQSLLVNSGASINAPNCEIDVLSTGSPAAIFNTTLNVADVCIKGSTDIVNGGAKPPVQLSCKAISDPFAGKLPSVTVGSCDFNNQTYNPGTITVNPGVYCGWTNFNGTSNITFNPGLYVIKSGGMTINSGSTITGTGVTFYLVDQNATIQFNGGITAALAAPTSGTYSGILVFEPGGLPLSNFVFNGSKGENMQGLLYMPSRNVTFNSVSNVSSEKITMVFDTLIMDSTNWAFDAGSKTMTNPNTGSKSAKLTN